ncbi:MAG: hypothetical protein ACOX6D_04415 [Thermoguttaceae bacterium]
MTQHHPPCPFPVFEPEGAFFIGSFRTPTRYLQLYRLLRARPRVFRYSNIPDILLRNNEPLESEEYSEPLTSQFRDMLLGVDLYSDHHCAACLGNRKLRPLPEKVDNTGRKVYRFS